MEKIIMATPIIIMLLGLIASIKGGMDKDEELQKVGIIMVGIAIVIGLIVATLI